ncbi:hypothetical protein IFM89_006246 [Coptis chinensis]|uniref:Histidine-containing phosphotransfer protein n=1 Tax=Coptis chinensis TaxID=261450 RepID=A0A835IRR5_9MAGN|nr:hypothetical protein IFM89_006246 [Coptis chinensis]
MDSFRASLKIEHRDLLFSMHDDEMLDDGFERLQSLQDNDNPNFLAETINIFCTEMDRVLLQIDSHFERDVMDFSYMEIVVHNLKGSISSVGACKVLNSCVYLRDAIRNNDQDRSMRAFNRMKIEYYTIRSKFQTLLELESRMRDCQTTISNQSASRDS